MNKNIIFGIIIGLLLLAIAFIIFLPKDTTENRMKDIDNEFREQSYLCDKLNSVDKEGFTYGLRTELGHIKCTLVGIEAP